MIVLMHVDDRLVHGQIFHFWVPEMQIEKIVVIDRAVSGNLIRKMVMEMGAPPQLKLEFKCPDTVENDLSSWLTSDERVLLIFGVIGELGEFILLLEKQGPEIFDRQRLKINIGALSSGPDREKLCASIYLDEASYNQLLQIIEMDLVVSAKNIPSDCENTLRVEDGVIVQCQHKG